MDAVDYKIKNEFPSSVHELADAMQEGLEARRSLSAIPLGPAARASFGHGTRHTLSVHGDLLKLPALARPGVISGPVRFARRLLKGLLGPWLDVQTRYNKLTLEVLESLHREIQDLKAYTADGYNGAVNRELGAEGMIARAGLWFNPPVSVQIEDNQPTVAAVTERILESIFVHTRLPRPAARVLDLGCAESQRS